MAWDNYIACRVGNRILAKKAPKARNAIDIRAQAAIARMKLSPACTDLRHLYASSVADARTRYKAGGPGSGYRFGSHRRKRRR